MAVQRNPSTMATIGSGESVLIREVNYTTVFGERKGVPMY